MRNMKLSMWWGDGGFGQDRPFVATVPGACLDEDGPIVSSNQVTSLACSILMDDAGLGLSHILDWTAEGVRRIEAVERGEIPRNEWCTEVFCAAFDADQTMVTSLLEETWRPTTLTTAVFRRMLTEWRDFIASTSSPSWREVEI